MKLFKMGRIVKTFIVALVFSLVSFSDVKGQIQLPTTQPMIIEVQTSIDSTMGSGGMYQNALIICKIDSFTILLNNFNGFVVWGDGDTTIFNSNLYFSMPGHRYSQSGLYSISIYGTATGYHGIYPYSTYNTIEFNFSTMNYPSGKYDNSGLRKVVSWGQLGLNDLSSAFSYCNRLESVPDSIPSQVTNLSNLFYGAKFYSSPLSLSNTYEYPGFNASSLSNWDVSNVTNMGQMFMFFECQYGCFTDLSNWDVSNVTDMGGMFTACNLSPGQIESWDVSNVTNMSMMFNSAIWARYIDFSNWNVSKVGSMFEMFAWVDYFNQDLSKWCVTNIPFEQTNFITTPNYNPQWKPNWGHCGVTCEMPNYDSISVTPTHNSVLLEWKKGDAWVNNTQIQMRVKGTQSWGGTTVSGEMHTFNSLQPSTTYEYRFRSKCAALNGSFTNIQEFTTNTAPVVSICQAPTNILATVNGNTSVTFNWTAAENGGLYFVQYKRSNQTWAQAGGTSTSSTTRTFNYLQPGTTYDYRIRTTCTPASTINPTSTFSSVNSFTTTGNAPTTAEFDNNYGNWSIYPNPSNDLVNLEFNADVEGEMILMIYDLSGRKVQEVQTQSLMGFNHLEISLRGLSNGTYFIKSSQQGNITPIGKVTKL